MFWFALLYIAFCSLLCCFFLFCFMFSFRFDVPVYFHKYTRWISLSSGTAIVCNAQTCHESGSHSLKLHITHGLHFPSCTALTHSRPPLHQSHSCHHSLINSDCLTTPAPHSLIHIKAAHKHSPSAKSCFPLVTFLSVLLFILLSLCLTPDCATLELWTCACDLNPCLVLFTSLLCLWYSCFCLLTIARLILPLSNKYILLHLDPLPLTSLYRRLRLLRSSSIISPTQLNHGQHKPTPTSSPGRPDYGRVCSPVLWAVLPGTVVRRVSVQELVLFRTHQSGQGQV